MADISTERQLSLADRKKLHAMRAIQDVALTLFESDGYRNVSVERVAAAVGTSPTTVYRYFGAKEMLVVWDDYDPQAIELLRTAATATVTPAELITEARAAARFLLPTLLGTGDEERIKRRMRLIVTEPDVRAGQMRLVEQIEAQVREVIAARLDRSPDDLDVRVAAAQAVWGFRAAVDHWAANGFHQPLRDVLTSSADTILAAVEIVFESPRQSTNRGSEDT